MAQQQVSAFDLSQEYYNQITNGGTGDISIQLNYHDDDPAGFEVTATGPAGSVVVCPRPCLQFNPPALS